MWLRRNEKRLNAGDCVVESFMVSAADLMLVGD